MLQTNKEKERMHNERVLQIENGLFSPILFAVNSTKGSRCNAVFSRIVELFLINKYISKLVATGNKFYTHEAFVCYEQC